MTRLATCLVVAATVLAGVAVPIAQAEKSTSAERRALEVRAWALGDQCTTSTLSSTAHRRLCGASGASNQPTAAELRALEIRGRAMNTLCERLSGPGYAAVCGGTAAAVVPAVVASDSFDWAVFGAGAGTVLGLTLLACGLVAGVHFGRRGSVRPRHAP